MNYTKTEIRKGDMKVIIRFSKTTQNQEAVEEEVKEILNHALCEQIAGLQGKDETDV